MFTTCTVCGSQQNATSTICTQCGKPLMGGNPYASPQILQPAGSPFSAVRANYNLAGVGERFAALLIDGFLNLAAALPGIIVLVIALVGAENSDEPPPLFYVGLGISILGSLIFNIYQWIMIARDGQSIGKKVMKVRIVKYETGEAPGWVHGVFLRLWLNGVLAGLPCGIGLIYTITDACFIFREDRRCVHDLLAQTCVIQA